MIVAYIFYGNKCIILYNNFPLFWYIFFMKKQIYFDDGNNFSLKIYTCHLDVYLFDFWNLFLSIKNSGLNDKKIFQQPICFDNEIFNVTVKHILKLSFDCDKTI